MLDTAKNVDSEGLGDTDEQLSNEVPLFLVVNRMK